MKPYSQPDVQYIVFQTERRIALEPGETQDSSVNGVGWNDGYGE